MISVNTMFFQAAFEVMGILAVITNCALVAMSPAVKQWLPSDFSPISTVLLFIAVEVSTRCF